MYLTQGLQRSLQRQPHRVGLAHLAEGTPPREHRFDALLDAVARQAAALAARGVAPGDRVALLAANDDRLVQAIYACWWLGAVACPLNVRWSERELAQALDDAEPTLLLADPALAPGVGAAARPTTPVADGPATSQAAGTSAAPAALPRLSFEAFAAEAAALPPRPDARCGGDALAALLYTGGTTGRSKGVPLTHANLWSASITRAAELPNSPASVSLLVAPLFHVAGLGRLVGQTIAGGACVTMAAFRPDAVIAAIERHRISDIIVVPTMLQALLDDPGFRPERVASLDRIAFGAAPMPPDLLERALAVWPRAEFFQAYGLTETSGAVCINGPENHRSPEARAAGKLHTVGRAGLGAEIVIADAEGREVPRGTVGEILCRGPMVTAGYWRNPTATTAAFVDGWLRTGDAGRMEDDGTLHVVDRLKDMIITGGENVYCAEVEAALRAHPAVAQAAVVGVPDARWGEAVQAFVVLRVAGGPGEVAAPDEAALRDWCRARLAGYKCPKRIAFVTELPVSAAGKVLKHVLRERARAAG